MWNVRKRCITKDECEALLLSSGTGMMTRRVRMVFALVVCTVACLCAGERLCQGVVKKDTNWCLTHCTSPDAFCPPEKCTCIDTLNKVSCTVLPAYEDRIPSSWCNLRCAEEPPFCPADICDCESCGFAGLDQDLVSDGSDSGGYPEFPDAMIRFHLEKAAYIRFDHCDTEGPVALWIFESNARVLSKGFEGAAAHETCEHGPGARKDVHLPAGDYIYLADMVQPGQQTHLTAHCIKPEEMEEVEPPHGPSYFDTLHHDDIVW